MKHFLQAAIIVLLLGEFFSSVSAQVAPGTQNYALIFPRTGDGFSATILRMDRDTIVVFTSDYKYIAKKDIGKIILHAKKESGKGFITGSILGTYLMNYWLVTANGQPGGFLWDRLYGSRYSYDTYYGVTPLSFIGIAMLGMAVGGGVGYLVDAGREANSENTYLFTGTPEMQQDQWAKVQEAVENTKTKHGKLHLNISGALVFPNVSNPYRDQLTSLGFNTTNTYNTYYGGYYSSSGSNINFNEYSGLQGSSDFNWLRDISLSYSATDNIQAGICYAILSEPSFIYSDEYNNVTPLSNRQSLQNRTVAQRLDGRGYYGIISYNRSIGKHDEFEVVLTGGAGFANNKFDLKAAYTVFDSTSSQSTSKQELISVHQTNFSFMASGLFSYYLYDSFSFGLKVSYYNAGKATAGPIPAIGITEQPLTFGNADIGFTIGMHF